MSESLWTLYLEGFCGLVVPFPRLQAMRRNPHLIRDWAEYQHLEQLELEYNQRKAEAQKKFWTAYAATSDTAQPSSAEPGLSTEDR